MTQDTDYEARVDERRRQGIALPEEDDESVESNVAFAVFLSDSQRDEVRCTDDILEKRRLIAKYAKQFSHQND